MRHLPVGSRDSGFDQSDRYTVLRSLLALKRWKEADQETSAILLELAGQTDENWLWLEDFAKIPRQELHAINQLWLEHSKNRFGFSVQQRLWCKALEQDEYQAECYLGDRVGWRHADGSWLTYDEVTFDLTAPRGHLPLALAWWVDGAGIVLGGVSTFWQFLTHSSSTNLLGSFNETDGELLHLFQ